METVRTEQTSDQRREALFAVGARAMEDYCHDNDLPVRIEDERVLGRVVRTMESRERQPSRR